MSPCARPMGLNPRSQLFQTATKPNSFQAHQINASSYLRSIRSIRNLKILILTGARNSDLQFTVHASRIEWFLSHSHIASVQLLVTTFTASYLKCFDCKSFMLYSTWYRHIEATPSYTILVILLRPKDVGKVQGVTRRFCRNFVCLWCDSFEPLCSDVDFFVVIGRSSEMCWLVFGTIFF